MSAFLDSNVLVYVADQRESAKHTIATELVDAALDGIVPCSISTQTLSEFANVALKKLRLEIELVEEYVDVFRSLAVVLPDADMVSRALMVKRRYGTQFYDSTMNAFLLHHRYADEQDGDKFVFVPEEVARVTMNKSPLQASMYFTPRQGTNEMHCAFSYYWDEPLTDVAWRFPDEEARVIAAYMKTIDWDARPDSREIEDEIRRLEALGAPKEKLRMFANALAANRDQAVKLAELADRIKSYRSEFVAEGLKEFK